MTLIRPEVFADEEAIETDAYDPQLNQFPYAVRKYSLTKKRLRLENIPKRPRLNIQLVRKYSLTKKRLRHTQAFSYTRAFPCPEVFADEEAIETSSRCRRGMPPTSRPEVFADEEAIETCRLIPATDHVDHPSGSIR